MGRVLPRVVIVLGREPEIDVARVASRAIAEAGGHVAVMIVGDRPNPAQATVLDHLLDLSSAWHDTLFVHDVSPAAVTGDDEVVIAATARERAVLERVFIPGSAVAG